MGLLDLLVAASMPVIQILLITALGLALALDRFAILGEDARKHLNNIVFYICNPSLISSNLSKTITYESMKRLWFMPLNIFITFIVGSILAWVVNVTPRAYTLGGTGTWRPLLAPSEPLAWLS
ncbi:hypothetical protein KY290_009862 [Solanum tuberosum]|uniref:Uncharacterized protein n=1 Tax=Solanum tuberosum TaxID=4113 RepID=A0ABQ7VY78_SOLTU|nr:hypothetical protein KY289_010243 [Solanum tuberosum]KAH0772725.1 hypothetical protein KY290_009862 [Solanum tuberosum]